MWKKALYIYIYYFKENIAFFRFFLPTDNLHMPLLNIIGYNNDQTTNHTKPDWGVCLVLYY